MTTKELIEKCPFCKYEVQCEMIEDIACNILYYIGCPRCGTRYGVYPTRLDAIEAWNKRIPSLDGGYDDMLDKACSKLSKTLDTKFVEDIAKLTKCLPSYFVGGNEHIVAAVRKLAENQCSLDGTDKYEKELEHAALILQDVLEIGKVKAIGLLEVATGIKQLIAERCQKLDGVVLTREQAECAKYAIYHFGQWRKQDNSPFAADWSELHQEIENQLAKLAQPEEKCTCPIPYTTPENCCEVSLKCPVHGHLYQPKQADVCEWKKSPRDEHGYQHETACGKITILLNPIIQNLQFCPYCGKKIEVVG